MTRPSLQATSAERVRASRSSSASGARSSTRRSSRAASLRDLRGGARRVPRGARAKEQGEKATIRAASFGIAGPVVDQRVKTTNLPWVIDARGRRASSDRARDAAERSRRGRPRRDRVAPSKLRASMSGRPKDGRQPRRDRRRHRSRRGGVHLGRHDHIACATEGSHVDFAPRTEVEVELWRGSRARARARQLRARRVGLDDC